MSERQKLSMIFNKVQVPVDTVALRPGPLRLTFENRTDSRVLPAVWVANQSLEDLLQRRKPVLTAKRLLTNQTFRDIYRTDTLDVDQRLKILRLTSCSATSKARPNFMPGSVISLLSISSESISGCFRRS